MTDTSSARRTTIAILQTGRLGDLWFAAPLAEHYSSQGRAVEIWYNEQYGNPFEFFPYVIPRPVHPFRLLPGSSVPANFLNWGAAQLCLYRHLRKLRREIIWNQIYPFRLNAYFQNKPYPEYWYRHHPEIPFRRATTSLDCRNDKTILYFAASQTLRAGPGNPLTGWLEENLEILRAHTGYRILYMPPPGSADHSKYETWRGNLSDYQRQIAHCGIVYGLSTSAHVLGQLLAKPVVACYRSRTRLFDTIGGETARIFHHDTLSKSDLESVSKAIAD